MTKINIREFKEQDTEEVWDIFHAVIQTGDTYVYNKDTPRSSLSQLWFAPPKQTFVAEKAGHIAGTYILKANHPDRGSHIANASFMVHPDHQGEGIGTGMCQHALEEARRQGFQAMQFNLVVSTNYTAVSLWEKMGFSIIGTVPQAFRHAQLGYVDAHIMYKKLSP